ncbi:MAG: hypothetical protein HYX61_02760 [Gammaproteobacteria bacterium]|nr:hypothetical protein [Gammaproteobacteria bacterium]
MGKENIIMLTALAVIAIQGCRWNDDFRQRAQPTYLRQPSQYLEPLPHSPTLNVESDDYEGNDTNKTRNIERNTQMPAIDDRSPIPEIQEFPPGL